MGKEPRLGLYFENSEIKRRLVVAAAKRGISPNAYCTRAIEEQLVRDGFLGDTDQRKEFIAKVDQIRGEDSSTENIPEPHPQIRLKPRRK